MDKSGEENKSTEENIIDELFAVKLRTNESLAAWEKRKFRGKRVFLVNHELRTHDLSNMFPAQKRKKRERHLPIMFTAATRYEQVTKPRQEASSRLDGRCPDIKMEVCEEDEEDGPHRMMTRRKKRELEKLPRPKDEPE
uniref:Protein SDA1 n=1 Tax=Steinernema glaseri TaxID=37863 RepID=A0A1I7YAG1_9BILA